MLSTKVDILLPIAPNSFFLPLTIDSIIAQNFPNWRIVGVINDSDEVTSEFLLSHIPEEKLTLVRVPVYFNLSQRLNAGLDFCTEVIVCRADADDTYSPDRLSRQVRFLLQPENQSVGMVGTFGSIINTKSKKIGEISHPCSHRDIEKILLYRNTFIHPSVMFRRDLIKNLVYSDAAGSTQDYELWLKLLNEGVVFANIAEELIHYRVHNNNSSHKKIGLNQIKRINALRWEYLRKKPSLAPYFLLGFIFWSIRHLTFSPNYFK